MNNIDKLSILGLGEATVFKNPDFDTAIIGTTDDGRAVYSFEKMVDFLVENENMDYEESIEFIEYNTIRSLPYIANAPVIVYDTDKF
jgi:hypothetical protein